MVQPPDRNAEGHPAIASVYTKLARGLHRKERQQRVYDPPLVGKRAFQGTDWKRVKLSKQAAAGTAGKHIPTTFDR